MTDKQKLDAIKAEIHRLVDVRGYDREMANDLLAFMNSLPNEPVSEELEEAAQEYTEKGSKCQEELDAFKAGANWQKQQILDSNTTLQRTFELGKQEMKQQMMAKAVKVNISNASIVSLPVNCNLKVGDKVLIIKEH